MPSPSIPGRDKTGTILMTDYHATIRHARAALDLIMAGAVKRITDQFPKGPNPEREAQLDDLIEHMHEELDGWITSKEGGVEPLIEREDQADLLADGATLPPD